MKQVTDRNSSHPSTVVYENRRSRALLRWMPGCIVPLMLLVLCGLMGCASVQSPVVQFVEVYEADRSSEATRLDFVLLVSNENAEPLPLRKFTYRFVLDNQVVHATRLTAQATVPQHGQSRILLPVIVRHESEGNPPSGARSYRLLGEVTYETAGKLAEALYDLKVRVPSVSFSVDGTVEFDSSGSVGGG